MYIALDADYLTILPDDIDPKVIGPVLCAGVTAYKVGKPSSVPWSSNMLGRSQRQHQSGKLARCSGCRRRPRTPRG
jgi:hypothetical protein